MLAPIWLRRTVMVPAVLVVTLALSVTLPVWLLLAAAASPLLPLGRWRALRVAWMAYLYLLLSTGALLSMGVLWVASGFGARLRSPAFERTHYDLVAFILRTLMREAERVLGVRLRIEGPGPATYDDRPLVVLSRHAGPGDSFLLVHALVNLYDREPRIVLKDTLQWDPAIDVLLTRLPNRFIRTGGGRPARDVREHVRALATGLDDNDAFVIFPEGGNFTERRRARAIARLREAGHLDAADAAERLRHVLPPRPGGVTAALAAAVPDTHGGPRRADVVFVAHTGTDHLISVADVWRALPLDTEVRMRWWHVPAAEVPQDEDAQVAWLQQWWARIDEWVGEHAVPAGSEGADSADTADTADEANAAPSAGGPRDGHARGADRTGRQAHERSAPMGASTSPGRAAQAAGDSETLGTLARVGYATSGILHLLIGWLAVRVALGSGEQADQSGALATLAQNGAGKLVLWVCVIGFVALGVWQLLEGYRRLTATGGDRKRGALAVAKGVVYLVLAYSSFSFARGGGKSSSQQSQDFTASLLEKPFGRGLVVVVGLIVAGVGVYHVAKGARKKFLQDLRRHPGATVEKLGVVGYVAKGVALLVVGGLFVLAGMRGSSGEATGLDGALKTLRDAPLGTPLLLVVAVGIAAYGVYSFARARHART